MFTKGIIFCIFIFLHIHPSLNLCIEHERRALLEIEKDIYDPEEWLFSWRRERDCCDWEGIFCNDTTGHVIGLVLQYPYQYHWSSQKPNASKLNPSLVDLKHLTYLTLSNNFFFGASIPKFIGSLTHLEHLDLYSAEFKGTIPPQLGNLSSLQTLRIDNAYDNPYSFDLRVDNLHWLSGLTSLTSLNMTSVNLSAAVDWVHDIAKLPSISEISFENNQLSSIPMTIPSLDNFTFLQTLDLYGNEFNSNIPSWLFYNISSLEALTLGNCGLYGELPLFSGQVSNLKYLDLPRNKFDGQVLRHLDRLPLLEELDLESNNISASISENFWNLTQLTILRLSNNNIGGKIPDSIGNLQKLYDFDVSTNLMSGEIPHSLFNITKLRTLALSNNNFSGRIPKSFANLNNLKSLDLSNNRLSGPVFFGNNNSLQLIDLSNNSLSGMFLFFQNIFSELSVLNLSNNHFSGTIPDLFYFHPLLKSLHMGKNKLYGLIPSSLKYYKELFDLDLSENKLYRKIPPWVGENLTSLMILNLRSNGFTGQIPRELSYLTSLQILDLSQNHLSGNFLLYFDNFAVMTEAKKSLLVEKISNYVEKIWLNKQGFVRQYYKSTLVDAIVIDISSNELSGEMSNGITTYWIKFFKYVSESLYWEHPKKY